MPISPKPFATPPWKAFAEDPAAELRDAFRVLDESPDAVAPDSAAVAAEVRAWRVRR